VALFFARFCVIVRQRYLVGASNAATFPDSIRRMAITFTQLSSAVRPYA
jgi:hypothetical protein